MQVNDNTTSSSSSSSSAAARSGYVSELPPRTSETAYLVYGRFQPPHKGHIEHMYTMLMDAYRYSADAYIIPSASFDENNPIITYVRVEMIQKMLSKLGMDGFPNYRVIDAVEIPNTGSPFIALNTLLKMGYKHIVLFASGDRLDSFGEMIKNYFTRPDITVEVRDTVRELTEEGKPKGISGSKLREIAIRTPFKRADFEKFKSEGYTIPSGEVLLSDEDIIVIIRNIRNSSGVPDIADESGKVIFAEGGRRSTRKRKQKKTKKSKKIRRTSRCRA